jgi:hypothetical protein
VRRLAIHCVDALLSPGIGTRSEQSRYQTRCHRARLSGEGRAFVISIVVLATSTTQQLGLILRGVFVVDGMRPSSDNAWLVVVDDWSSFNGAAFHALLMFNFQLLHAHYI